MKLYYYIKNNFKQARNIDNSFNQYIIDYFYKLSDNNQE